MADSVLVLTSSSNVMFLSRQSRKGEIQKTVPVSVPSNWKTTRYSRLDCRKVLDLESIMLISVRSQQNLAV